MATAAIVIIGNEILTGKFRDENGPYLVDRLRALGVDVGRLVTIPDIHAEIADEVRACASRFDHVFTTGGVGPTHDDITLESIATAFGLELEVRPELVELLRHHRLPEDEATMRMATVPVGAELVRHETTRYPAIKVRNVWVFPGIPALMKQKFEIVAPRFAGEAVHTARFYCRDSEMHVAKELAEVAARHPTVDIGSYPRFGETEHSLIVTLESRDQAALAQARSDLAVMLDVVRAE